MIFLITALLIVKIEFSVQEEKKTNRIIGREYLISLRDGFSLSLIHILPIEVRPDRRQALGLRWLTGFSRARGEKAQAERLANEIMEDLYKRQCQGIYKRERR